MTTQKGDVLVRNIPPDTPKKTKEGNNELDMSDFWQDDHHKIVLKECVSCVLRETNSGPLSGSGTDAVLLFVARIASTNSIAMEIFDGVTFRSRMRFSGLPQRKPTTGHQAAQEGTNENSALLDYEALPPIKQKVVDLVDILFSNEMSFNRIVLRLEKLKRQLWTKVTFWHRRSSLVMKDDQNRLWGYALQCNPVVKNDVFEAFVEWLENGSQGRAPSGDWNGFYTIGRIAMEDD